MQSSSQFIDYAGVNESYAKFASPVHAGNLLDVIVSLAGGNPYVVDHLEDDLGNTWHKTVSGRNGDNTDVEIWYTNSAASGADKVDAYLKALPGATSQFLQSYITVGEFSGSATFHAAHVDASSHGGWHSSGSFASVSGDLIVGGYADAGYVGNLSIADTTALFGKAFYGIDAIQSIQSYGVANATDSSVVYRNTRFARSVVAGASFTPTT